MITNITLTNKIDKGIIGIAVNDGSKAITLNIGNGNNSWQVEVPIGGTVDWVIPADALSVGTTTFTAVFGTVTSNQLDITIKVAIDKVNRFVSVYAETGAFIKVEAAGTYSAIKNNATGMVYFDYPSDLSSLLFKVTLLNDANNTI